MLSAKNETIYNFRYDGVHTSNFWKFLERINNEMNSFFISGLYV